MMFYNFARISPAFQKTLCVTPAMAAAVADHDWTMGEIAALVP
jgi:hypothetical protein